MNGNSTEKTQEARNTNGVENERDMGIHPPRNPEIDSLLELLGPPAPSTAQKQRSSLPISSTSIPAPKVPAPPPKLPLVQQNVQSKVEEPPLETISEDEALQLRSMTFPQALMLVPTLPPYKISKLTEIRKQQDKLEKTLHTEYSVMNSKYTNARRELEQKATLARIDLSRDMARLDGDFAKKVDAFKTKALSRWSELVRIIHFKIHSILTTLLAAATTVTTRTVIYTLFLRHGRHGRNIDTGQNIGGYSITA